MSSTSTVSVYGVELVSTVSLKFLMILSARHCRRGGSAGSPRDEEEERKEA